MTIHPLIKIERLTYKATGGQGDRPENTWAAFKFALENGITTLELDTVMTADQTIIIHHDTVLNPKICQYSGGQDLNPHLSLRQTMRKSKNSIAEFLN